MKKLLAIAILAATFTACGERPIELSDDDLSNGLSPANIQKIAAQISPSEHAENLRKFKKHVNNSDAPAWLKKMQISSAEASMKELIR